MSDPRVELNPSHVAWTVLKELRDKNQEIANEADLLMRAIEAAPEIDKAMCTTMGIRPKLPPQMGKPGFEIQPK